MDLSRSTALQVKLVALNDGDAIRERTVRLSVDDPLTIGRASSNRGVAAAHDNTKIDNKVISKEHATIRTDSAGDNVFLKDLKSMHGTKVNGVDVPRGGEVTVASGAQLQFGVSVIRGSETYKPALYRVEYRMWDPFSTPGPSEPEPLADCNDRKRGYTDDVSNYSEDEEDDCHIVVPETYLANMPTDGEDEERASLFGGIRFEDDSSISEDELEEEMDYPEESEAEEDESSSDSGDALYYGPMHTRSTTPPAIANYVMDLTGGPADKGPLVKRFQNSIADLVDQPPVTTMEELDIGTDQPSEVEDLLRPGPVVDNSASPTADWKLPFEVPRDSLAPPEAGWQPVDDGFVDVHQKVENLIADARAEVEKAQEPAGSKPTVPRLQKRTADQAELDDVDTPKDNEAKEDEMMASSPVESPRKRTTAQFLRSVARDTTIFAAGGIAMLVGLAKLPNNLAP